MESDFLIIDAQPLNLDFRSVKDSRKFAFLEAYTAWVTAVHAEMKFEVIQEYWTDYVQARELWLAC